MLHSHINFFTPSLQCILLCIHSTNFHKYITIKTLWIYFILWCQMLGIKLVEVLTRMHCFCYYYENTPYKMVPIIPYSILYITVLSFITLFTIHYSLFFIIITFYITHLSFTLFSIINQATIILHILTHINISLNPFIYSLSIWSCVATKIII